MQKAAQNIVRRLEVSGKGMTRRRRDRPNTNDEIARDLELALYGGGKTLFDLRPLLSLMNKTLRDTNRLNFAL